MNYKTITQNQTIQSCPFVITPETVLEIPEFNLKSETLPIPRIRLWNYEFGLGFHPETEVVFYNLILEHSPSSLRKVTTKDNEGKLSYFDIYVMPC